MQAGDWFGEYALAHRVKSGVSLRAADVCKLNIVFQDDWKQVGSVATHVYII